MCSSNVQDETGADDRTTRARIRDAAIDCIAEHGLTDTTVRKIAAAAGVSPGLVIHHFGSMDALREACDQHVADEIRRQKSAALSSGPQLDLLGSLRDSDYGSMIGYLAAVLVDDSPVVARLVDEIAADAAEYLGQGEATGMLRPTDDPQGRAAVLTLWSLGLVVLHHHMKRLLGVDITDPGVATDPSFLAYLRPAAELLGTGIYTDEFAAQVQRTLAPGSSGQQTDEDNQDEDDHDD